VKGHTSPDQITIHDLLILQVEGMLGILSMELNDTRDLPIRSDDGMAEDVMRFLQVFIVVTQPTWEPGWDEDAESYITIL